MRSSRKKTLRCASCGKRIREHQTDLEVLEAASGSVRYYHERCGEAAYAAAHAKGGAWLCTVREVDASRN